MSFDALALILVAALFGIYLSWPTADYSYDAVSNVSQIHRAVYMGDLSRIWHEYHMVYMPFGYVVAGILDTLGSPFDILSEMQVVNALITVLGLWVFAHVVWRVAGHSGISLAATAILGLSYSVWFYATDPEPYPLSILFILLAAGGALWLLGGGGWGAAAVTGVMAGAAFAVHVGGGWVTPAVASAALAEGSRASSIGRRFGTCAVLLGLSAVVGLAPYEYHYRVNEGVSLVRGFADLVVSASETESALGTRWFFDRGLEPVSEAGGVARGLVADPVISSQGLDVAAGALRMLLLVLVMLVLWRGRAVWKSHRRTTVMILLWLGSTFLFFSAYNVGSRKFVGFILVPLLILVGLAASTLPRPRLVAGLLAVLAAGVGLVNFVGRIAPDSELANNLHYQRAMFVRHHTNPSDLVIHIGYGPSQVQKVYLPYFAERRTVILDFVFSLWDLPRAEGVDFVQSEIRGCWNRGGHVYVLGGTLAHSETVSRWEERCRLPSGFIDKLMGPYRPLPVARHDSGMVLFLLQHR